MEDTYKGESPAKKFARIRYWDGVRTKMQDRFYDGKHLVLASREAGDVSVLLGLGVDPKNIIGVDMVDSAVSEAREKFPNVSFEVGDVAKVAERHRFSIRSVYLDLCSPYSPEIENLIVRTTKCLRSRAVLGLAVLAGRERGETRKAFIEHQRESALSSIAREAFWERAEGHRDDEPNYVAHKKEARDKLKATERGEVARQSTDPYAGTDSQTERTEFIEGRLETALAERWTGIVLGGSIYYNSNTREAKGIPMLCLYFRTERGMAGMRPEEIIKKMRSSPGTLPPSDLGHTKDHVMAEIDQADITSFSVTEQDVINFACRHPDPNVHLLLNVPRQTLSAWRAHMTMGTYAGQDTKTFPSPYRGPNRAGSGTRAEWAEDGSYDMGEGAPQEDWREAGVGVTIPDWRNEW